MFLSPKIETVRRSQTSLLRCLLPYRAAEGVHVTRTNPHPREQQHPPLVWPLFLWQVSTFDMLQDGDRNEGTPEIPDPLVNLDRFRDLQLLSGVLVMLSKLMPQKQRIPQTKNSRPNNPVSDLRITLFCSYYIQRTARLSIYWPLSSPAATSTTTAPKQSFDGSTSAQAADSSPALWPPPPLPPLRLLQHQRLRCTPAKA